MTTVIEPFLPKGRNEEANQSGRDYWKVRSLDSLHVSWAGLTLSKEQLDTLPKSLMQDIYDGFTRLIRASSKPIPKDLESMRLSVVDDQIKLIEDSGEEFDKVHFGQDVQLQKAQGKVVDQARIYFPEAFKGPRAIPTTTVANDKEYHKGLAGYGFEAVCESTNALSVTRNGMIANNTRLKSTANIGTIGALGVLGGISSFGIGAKIFRDGVIATQKAYKCGDNHGVTEGVFGAGVGGAFAGVGVTMVEGFLPDAASLFSNGPSKIPISTATNAAFTLAGNILIIGMGGCMLASSVHNLLFSGMGGFRDQLLRIIDNQSISKEEKARQALEFLSQQIGVTEGEMDELTAKYGQAAKYGQDLKGLETAKKNLAEAKWAVFVRRVGEECAVKVAKEIGSIQAGLKSGDKKAAFQAIELLKAVDKESFKMRQKHLIQLLLSFLYIAVGIISFTNPLSIWVPILFALGAGIFFLIDAECVHNLVNGNVYDGVRALEEWWKKPKPLTERNVTMAVGSAKDGNNWNLFKLKEKVEKALLHAKHISLKIVPKKGAEIPIGRIESFDHLVTVLKLKKIAFDKESRRIAENSADYYALQFMDALQIAILKVDQPDFVPEILQHLKDQGVDLSLLPEWKLSALDTTNKVFNATHMEEAPHPPIEISSDNAQLQLVNAG